MNNKIYLILLKIPILEQEFENNSCLLCYIKTILKLLRENPDESPRRIISNIIIIEPVYDACFKGAEHYKFSVFEGIPEESDFNSIKNQIRIDGTKNI